MRGWRGVFQREKRSGRKRKKGLKKRKKNLGRSKKHQRPGNTHLGGRLIHKKKTWGKGAKKKIEVGVCETQGCLLPRARPWKRETSEENGDGRRGVPRGGNLKKTVREVASKVRSPKTRVLKKGGTLGEKW